MPGLITVGHFVNQKWELNVRIDAKSNKDIRA